MEKYLLDAKYPDKIINIKVKRREMKLNLNFAYWLLAEENLKSKNLKTKLNSLRILNLTNMIR